MLTQLRLKRVVWSIFTFQLIGDTRTNNAEEIKWGYADVSNIFSQLSWSRAEPSRVPLLITTT